MAKLTPATHSKSSKSHPCSPSGSWNRRTPVASAGADSISPAFWLSGTLMSVARLTTGPGRMAVVQSGSCPPSAAPVVRASARPRPASRLLVGALGAAVVALASCGGSGSSGPSTPPLRRRHRGAGIDHRYDGDFEFFVGGGVAAFDCDDDGRDELFFAGGSEPGRAVPQRQPDRRRRCGSTQLPSPVTDLTAVTGAYPLDVDSDGRTDLVVLRVAGTCVLRGLGDCRFERPTRRSASTRRRAGRPPSARRGRASNRLPTLAFGDYLVPGRGPLRRQPAAAAGRRRRPATPRRSRSRPATARCRCCSATGSHSGRRDLRMSNDRHYYRDGDASSCGGSSPASRRREYTEADGWRPLQIWGMGIASQDLTGDGLPEVFLTSQGDNKLQTLADGADAATPTLLADIAPRTSRGHRASARSPAATCSRRRPGTPSSPTSTTTASSTCSSPRATSRRRPTTRAVTRTTC